MTARLKPPVRAGMFFKEPNGVLEAGKLRLNVYGQASNVEESWIDLVSNGGNSVHGLFPLQLSGSKTGLLATGEIDLPEDLHGFELHLNANSQADIAFSHHDLEIFPD